MGVEPEPVPVYESESTFSPNQRFVGSLTLSPGVVPRVLTIRFNSGDTYQFERHEYHGEPRS